MSKKNTINYREFIQILFSVNKNKEYKKLEDYIKQSEPLDLNPEGDEPLLTVACFEISHSTNKEIVKLLLEKGVNPNLLGPGKNPLWYIISSWLNSPDYLKFDYYRELVELFLDKGAKLDLQHSSGEDSPIITLLKINETCAKYLEIEKPFKKEEWTELVKMFLDKKPNLNHTNDYGETPLLISCASIPELTTILLDHGADIDYMFSNIVNSKFNMVKKAQDALTWPQNSEMIKKFTDSFLRNLVFDEQGKVEEHFIEIICNVLKSKTNNGVFLLETYFERKEEVEQCIFIKKVLDKLFDKRWDYVKFQVETDVFICLPDLPEAKKKYLQDMFDETHKEIVIKLFPFIKKAQNTISIEEKHNDYTEYLLKLVSLVGSDNIEEIMGNLQEDCFNIL